MKISRIILIILLFFVFFEIGLFSSYTLATGEVPDPGELINMQLHFSVLTMLADCLLRIQTKSM